MPKLPDILNKRIISDPQRGRIEQLDLVFSNGVKRTFERSSGVIRQAVIIVPLLDENTVLLVREYAAGLHAYELGLPKGRMEANEDILESANRELKEEIGYGARQLHIHKQFSTAPSYMAHQMNMVIARDLYEERLVGDEPEELEVVPWPLNDLLTLSQREDCTDARSIAALWMTHAWLKQNKS